MFYVYLTGSILGYSKVYMDIKYEEIITFAELKDFTQVPLKNYSSGMKARLGFAIATMNVPDILMVCGALYYMILCKNKFSFHGTVLG